MASEPKFNSQGFRQGDQDASEDIPSRGETFSQGGFVDISIPVAPKRLIVCCDGTWQSSVSGLKNVPSNVTRLARSIARSGKDKDGKVWQQIVHYDAGIGTGDLSAAEADRQGGFGIGFVGNVIEAYNFLVLNYNPGDEIFCFGFSRGAYTARAVAGLVTDIGIISPKDLQDFPDLYALYQGHKDSFNFRKSKAYREWTYGVLSKKQPEKVEGGFQPGPAYDKAPRREAPEASRVVQIVGVFDTVGSLGIPDLDWTSWNLKFLEKYTGIPDVGFHNVSLSPYIKHAFHALALDEHRKPFTPTLWHLEGDQRPDRPDKSRDDFWAEWWTVLQDTASTEKQLAAAYEAYVDAEVYAQLKGAKPELLQVWFPGVHINIGGGSDDILKEKKGDFEQIALISFAWMCEQVAPYLALAELGELGYLAASVVEDRWRLVTTALDEIAKKEEKDHGSHWAWSRTSAVLDKTGLKKAKLKEIANVVVNGWATGPIIDSYEGKMALGGSLDRSPGQYTTSSTGKPLGATNEMIHPSVQYRLLKRKDYKPKALNDFKRSAQESGKNGYVWKKGNVTIPEYLIKPKDTFTRYLAQQDSLGSEDMASDFIGNIDRLVGVETQEADILNRRERFQKERAAGGASGAGAGANNGF